MKEPMVISMSGGRTSAYMAKRMIDEWGDKYDLFTIFANTGIEHEKTLEFVNNCDKQFGFNTTWLECSVNHGERVGTSYKIVDYETASRKGEPFEEVIKKYGFPNLSYLHCTRELKLAPIKTYMKRMGIENAQTAIGIRADEYRRVSDTAEKQKIIYPLAVAWPTIKRQVLEFWGKQSFDLGIEEFEGNCLGCFKKSINKQLMQIEKDPSVFDFFRRMEEKHQKERSFFRENMDTEDLFKLYSEINKTDQLEFILEYGRENGGCSESCEVFDMS